MLKIIACDDDVAFLDNLHRMINRWSAETGTAVDVALVTRGEDLLARHDASRADIIMLDNMSTELLKQCIDYIDGRAEIEVSGNVTKENIQNMIDVGVDYVSSGALTHSAPIMDISLKNLHAI